MPIYRGLLCRVHAPREALTFCAILKTRFDSPCGGPEKLVHLTSERKIKMFTFKFMEGHSLPPTTWS